MKFPFIRLGDLVARLDRIDSDQDYLHLWGVQRLPAGENIPTACVFENPPAGGPCAMWAIEQGFAHHLVEELTEVYPEEHYYVVEFRLSLELAATAFGPDLYLVGVEPPLSGEIV